MVREKLNKGIKLLIGCISLLAAMIAIFQFIVIYDIDTQPGKFLSNPSKYLKEVELKKIVGYKDDKKSDSIIGIVFFL